jgi:hypothetical protein
MDNPKDTLLLFDIDGTLTKPRNVLLSFITLEDRTIRQVTTRPTPIQILNWICEWSRFNQSL